MSRQTRRILGAVAGVLLACVMSGAPTSAPLVLGPPAPDWAGRHWVDTPLSLGGLRGKVVLVRWWMSGCRYCAATAPALNELYRDRSEERRVGKECRSRWSPYH